MDKDVYTQIKISTEQGYLQSLYEKNELIRQQQLKIQELENKLKEQEGSNG